MRRREFFITTVVLAATLSGASAFGAPQSIEMFDTPLKGAKRDQLRQVFKKNGMIPTREDSSYWVDLYDSNRMLQGATHFEVGYTMKAEEFAYARYTFPGSMNTGLVKDVIDLVVSKYGQPSKKNGQYHLGPVTATWMLGKNMKIEVSRGWPETTTYLSFIDIKSYSDMKLEMDNYEKKIKQQKAKEQGKAF